MASPFCPPSPPDDSVPNAANSLSSIAGAFNDFAGGCYSEVSRLLRQKVELESIVQGLEGRVRELEGELKDVRKSGTEVVMGCLDKAIKQGGEVNADDLEPLIELFGRKRKGASQGRGNVNGGKVKVVKEKEGGGQELKSKNKYEDKRGEKENDEREKRRERAQAKEKNYRFEDQLQKPSTSSSSNQKRDSCSRGIESNSKRQKKGHESNKESSHDNNDSKNKNKNEDNSYDFKFKDVVRGEKRRELPGHECEECQKFYSALCDGNSIFDKSDMLKACSRHRSRFTPDMTPDDFWEMSFVDEIKERKEKSSNGNNYDF